MNKSLVVFPQLDSFASLRFSHKYVSLKRLILVIFFFLHVRRPFKTLNLEYCVLCLENSKTVDHPFLHCPMAWNLFY